MLSESVKDCIRALIYLALNQDKEYISVKEISEALNLPFFFLAKNIQKLVKEGILESYRGPKGGISFKKPINEIKIIDIIVAIDGDNLFKKCVLGFEECSDLNPCAIHHKWVPEREHLKGIFNATLYEIVNDIKQGKIKNIKL
ncbi:Rrf2 family protein [Sulfurihydrogenibium azorense Az-Fu1]|jgi:Rrf2 family protein|uniref:Rrf2 family protein n=1 Tax=Sulfurihydrogenibium azorense (strain DSM 15241 / OCM 825 / Az-Fu1) TaxID=204536 RepID=C1DV64_SULAA|nr:Rrf2 family transcriptional regulator [Sulfurihydrogenibium azorense]ACN98262.1 Rrf2 family protein [Sulfurihydrogenibium azorense Az-Fu1]